MTVKKTRLIAAGACSILLAATAGLVALTSFDGPFVGFATNSDTLLASAWTQLVWREGYSFSSFQLPQTTSLFPDLFVHSMFQLASGSWREASLLYGFVQFGALIIVAGLVVHQITGASRLLGSAIFTALTTALFADDVMQGSSGLTRMRIVLEIAAHGGAFLLTVFGSVLICRMLVAKTGRATWLLLVGLSAAAYLSDQLTIFEFDAPAFLVLLWLLREIGWRQGLRIGSAVALGMIVGEIGILLVNHERSGLHLGSLRQLIMDSSPFVWLYWYAPAALVFGLPLLPLDVSRRLGLDFTSLPTRFYWRFAPAAALITLGVAVLLLYLDQGGFRYFHALAWWPVILASAPLAAALENVRYSAILASAVALLIQAPQVPLHAPAILTWTSPTADCLMDHRRQEDLKAGLAGYWEARQIEASTNWRLQMEQISSDGQFYLWGNDEQRYKAELPDYNFIVMADLDRDRIARTYGKPSRILDCAGSPIWIYPDRRIETSAPP